jgi:hypothetical protein
MKIELNVYMHFYGGDISNPEYILLEKSRAWLAGEDDILLETRTVEWDDPPPLEHSQLVAKAVESYRQQKKDKHDRLEERIAELRDEHHAKMEHLDLKINQLLMLPAPEASRDPDEAYDGEVL